METTLDLTQPGLDLSTFFAQLAAIPQVQELVRTQFGAQVATATTPVETMPVAMSDASAATGVATNPTPVTTGSVNNQLGGTEGETFSLRQDGTNAIFDNGNPANATPVSAGEFNLNAGAGDDSLTITELNQTGTTSVKFTGSDGNDTLNGTKSTVPINATGDTGNDVLKGGVADDTLNGGAGDDRLVGRAGKDTMLGEGGNDRFIWNPGDGSDVLDGGEGLDSAVVNQGDKAGGVYALGAEANNHAVLDRINTPFSMDMSAMERVEVNGGKEADTLNLDSLAATGVNSVQFKGGEGGDVMLGSATDVATVAFGGAGNDILVGGSVGDSLNGEQGDDTLQGNAGADRFVFSSNSPFKPEDLGKDTVNGFTGGEDKVVLQKETFSKLQSGVGNGFSNAAEFASVDSDTAADLSDALIVYNKASGGLFYNSNGKEAGFGDGGQFAAVTGAPALTANDFVLQDQSVVPVVV